VIATPVFLLQGIRGNLFFDVGGAWYDDFEDFDFYDSDEGRLVDATAAYGFGVTVRFVGLDLNWDFARVTKFADDEDSNFETSFWIGTRF
jgi:outer membrane protein assembly factor BamA